MFKALCNFFKQWRQNEAKLLHLIKEKRLYIILIKSIIEWVITNINLREGWISI